MKKPAFVAMALWLAGTAAALAQAPIGIAGPGPSGPLQFFWQREPSSETNGQYATGPEDQTARVWGSADYLMWWIKGSNLPPLATGGIASPVATDLFAGDVDNSLLRVGGRFRLGGWFDSDQTLGAEGGYFFLGTRSAHLNTSSTGTPYLAIPYINAVTGQAASLILAQPSQTITTTGPAPIPGVAISRITTTTAAAGSVAATLDSRLQGTDVDLTWNVIAPQDDAGAKLTLLGGFRYLNLAEGLGLTAVTTATGSNTFRALATPAVLAVRSFSDVEVRTDGFEAHNSFYGGQFGARGEYRWGNLIVSILGELALGGNQEIVNVAGSTARTFSGTTLVVGPPRRTTPTQFQQQLAGGILAQPTNSGRFTRNAFVIAPETDISIGYQFTRHLRASVGYTFLYWSDVARPGSQIDTVINPAFFTTPTFAGPPAAVAAAPARPAFLFHETDFWAQGVNLGLEVSF